MLTCKLAPWGALLVDAVEAILFLFTSHKAADQLWKHTTGEHRLAAIEAECDSLEPNQLEEI